MYRLLTLLLAASLLPIAVHAQGTSEQPASSTSTTAIGGTGRVSLRMNPANSGNIRASDNRFGLSPYFLRPTDKESVQNVIQVGLVFDRSSRTLDNDFVNANMTFGATVYFGKRHAFFTAKRFFCAAEYGFGPTFNISTAREEQLGFDPMRTSAFTLGGGAYFDVVVGYRFTNRLTVVSDFVNARASLLGTLNDTGQFTSVLLSGSAQQGFEIGAEWRLGM